MKNDCYKKWKPFDSLFESKKILEEIDNDKHKIDFPHLSDDQISSNAQFISEAYQLHEAINVKYFYNNSIYNIKGFVDKIDNTKKMIYINKHQIYFIQIINVTI